MHSSTLSAVPFRWRRAEWLQAQNIASSARPMITICHPVDDQELIIIRMELEAEEIPCFVLGEHFGSLYPGVQIPWYNERSIQVRADDVPSAAEVIQRVRAFYEPSAINLSTRSKLRILCEALLCGWAIPAGSKKSSKSAEQSDEPPPDGRRRRS